VPTPDVVLEAPEVSRESCRAVHRVSRKTEGTGRAGLRGQRAGVADETDVDDGSAGGVALDGLPRAIRLTLVGPAIQALREIARLMRPNEANAPTS